MLGFLGWSWPESYLWRDDAERIQRPPTYILQRGCVYMFSCEVFVDELRQRVKEECCGYAVFVLRRKCDTFTHAHMHTCTHTWLWSCETTAQWPPAVSMQKAVISDTKQSTGSVCVWLVDPPPSSTFYVHQSIIFTHPAWRLNGNISTWSTLHTKHTLDYVVYRHEVWQPWCRDRGPILWSGVRVDLSRTVGWIQPSPVLPNLLFQSPSHYHCAQRSINNSLRLRGNKSTWESQSDLAALWPSLALNKSLIYCTWSHQGGWMQSATMQMKCTYCVKACAGVFCVWKREKDVMHSLT